MKKENFPEEIQPYLIPGHNGQLIYRCLGCYREYGIEELLYTCPECKDVLLIYDKNFKKLKEISGNVWQKIFDL